MEEVEYTFEELVSFQTYLGSLSNYTHEESGIRMVIPNDPKMTAMLDELAQINKRRGEILKQFEK